MAKLESLLHGDFEYILDRIESEMLSGNISATLEDYSDYYSDNCRYALRVFERYSFVGRNRVSLSLLLMQDGDDIHLTAITAGGSQAIFLKMNTLGEQAYLNKLKEIIDYL